MYIAENCQQCGDCFVNCQWIDADQTQAIAWIKQLRAGEHAEVLDKCITCYACNETCPNLANPFDLIAVLQEKYHTPVSESTVSQMEQRYLFSGDLKAVPHADRILSLCVFNKTDAHLIQGPIYNLPQVSGKPYFCWVLFSHMAGESVQRKHARELVDRLAQTGAKEVVCFHDDCYAMLAKLAPDYGIEMPFRPIHLSQYLVEYLTEHQSAIKPLNLDIAYSRPCASRFTPEKEPFIDKLFELIGVHRVQRTYDRENALCCGGAKLMLSGVNPKPDQEKNFVDAKQAGAQAMVCLCPMCLHSFSIVAAEQQLPLIFIGDLARMALGEIEVPV
jgi:Fe-S oxidoreductase